MPEAGIWIKPRVIVRSPVRVLVFRPKVDLTVLDFEICMGKTVNFFNHRADYRARNGNFTILAVNLRVQETHL